MNPVEPLAGHKMMTAGIDDLQRLLRDAMRRRLRREAMARRRTMARKKLRFERRDAQ